MALRNTTGFLPVTAAIVGNALVTIAKFGASLASGSSVMFSEAIHSAADTLNQVLLLIGLRRSLKKPDESFEYGYGNERFFWALISACGVFFVGAGVTAYKGITSFLVPPAIEFSPVVFIVLFVAFVVELYTFRIAALALKRAWPHAGFFERSRLADPMTLAVYLEDAVAVAGVVIAAFAIGASYYTGNPDWDAAGSIVISLFLAATAVVLIVKNRSFLLGRAMPEELQEKVLEIFKKDPAIERVIDFKSTTIDWGVYRIKCEIDFNGGSLLRAAYRGKRMPEQYEELKNDYEAFKRFSADYADRISRLIGKKIDEIEARVKKAHPEIRHIDIEIN